MNNDIFFRAAAAAMSGIIAFSALTGMSSGEEISETATAEYETSDSLEIMPPDMDSAVTVRENWQKADISQYDSSLSLVSYELTDPEMYKTGDGLTAVVQENSDDRDKPLNEEDVAAMIKRRSALKKASPMLTRKKTNVTPTEVESYTSGGVVGSIPDVQTLPTVYANPGEFAFITYGWGHGVGMSQNGANFYATYSGWTYQDILYHYYPGTYLMNTGLTDQEQLTVCHVPAGDTLDLLSRIVYNEVGGTMAYEAIKAQAVAAYTYMKYNGDDANDLRPKDDPPQIVIDACREVLGQALYYNGDYALTMFSASSGGCSANSYEIFYQDLPYLRSVPSDYDAACDPHYGTVTYITAGELKNRIESRYGITLSSNPYNWIQPIYSPSTGYITDVIIDGQMTVKGYAFSLAMGLKSCKFGLVYTDYEGYMDGSGTGGSDGRPQLPSVITPPDHSVEVPTVQPPVTEPLPDEPVTEPVEPSTDEPFTVPSEPSAEEPPTEPSTQEVDPYVSSTQTEIVTTTAAFSEETESILTE